MYTEDQLELVTNFNSLKEADLVLLKCGWCNNDHVGFLNKLEGPKWYTASNGSRSFSFVWTTVPDFCKVDTISVNGRDVTGYVKVSPLSIERKQLYRIIIPDVKEKTKKQKRSLIYDK